MGEYQEQQYNIARLKHIKRAKLKQREAELQYYSKKGDIKKVTETRKDIRKLKRFLNNN